MKSIVRNYQLTDEILEVILDRLSRFRDDPDAALVGEELARQQNYNPNHIDSPGLHVSTHVSPAPNVIKANPATMIENLIEDQKIALTRSGK
jgi:hypothetical protein